MLLRQYLAEYSAPDLIYPAVVACFLSLTSSNHGPKRVSTSQKLSKMSKPLRTGIKHYRSGLSHEEDQLIPNPYRYVSWSDEITTFSFWKTSIMYDLFG